MRSLDSEIARKAFKSVYLLFGKEHYLLKENREKLFAALGVTDRSDMNFTLLRERDFEVTAFIADCDTLPFFAERRVVLVEESGYFKGNKSKKDALVDYVAQIPESTVAIFVESEVDKRDRLYKAISKRGTAEEFVTGKERDLEVWIGKRLSEDGIQMRREAWSEFYLRCGFSMDLMNAEYLKLSAYCWQKKQIELSDVEAVCSNASQTKIFELSDAISERDPARVFHVYQDMLRQNEKAPSILALIQRQLLQLYDLKVMEREGASFEMKKNALSISYDFILRKLDACQKRFGERELLALLEKAAGYEEDFKSGRLEEGIAVELLLCETIAAG